MSANCAPAPSLRSFALLPLSFALLQKSKIYLPSFQSCFALLAQNNRGVPPIFLPKGSARVPICNPPVSFHPMCPIEASPLNSVNAPPPCPFFSHRREELRPTSNSPSLSSSPSLADEHGHLDHHRVDPPPQTKKKTSAVAIGAVRPLAQTLFTTSPLRSRTFSSDRHPRLASLRRQASAKTAIARSSQHIYLHRAHPLLLAPVGCPSFVTHRRPQTCPSSN